MDRAVSRRRFLRNTFAGAATACFSRFAFASGGSCDFGVSLTEQSLARSISAGSVAHLDLAQIAKEDLGISAIEYSSEYFRDKVDEDGYLDSMNARAADHDVRQLLIKVSGEGHIGDADARRRKDALQAHQRWVEVAKALGCHSIQVDASSSGNATEQQKRAADGLRAICEYAAKRNIHILVGNCGGITDNPAWVLNVVTTVNTPYCGTLPLVKTISSEQDIAALASIVTFAKGITATADAFDEHGDEKHIDYVRVMNVIHGAGYGGYVGICFSGDDLDELAGIRATKSLLDRIRDRMAIAKDSG